VRGCEWLERYAAVSGLSVGVPGLQGVEFCTCVSDERLSYLWLSLVSVVVVVFFFFIPSLATLFFLDLLSFGCAVRSRFHILSSRSFSGYLAVGPALVRIALIAAGRVVARTLGGQKSWVKPHKEHFCRCLRCDSGGLAIGCIS
jgi:hypothetical protein